MLPILAKSAMCGTSQERRRAPCPHDHTKDTTTDATRPAPKDHTTNPQTDTGAHDQPTSTLRPTHNQSTHTTPPRVRTGIKTNIRTLNDESEHSHMHDSA
jgi:hypothetical protein